MADRKYHWAVPVPDPSKHRHAWKAYVGGHYAQACGRKPAIVLGDTAAQFVAKVKTAPDWYCVTCTKAARLALAKEQPIAVSFSSTVRRCARCRSGAINPSDHGRTEGADLDLCDVCYWRKRAPEPKPIIEYTGDDPVLGLCCRHGWLTIKPERSKTSGRVIGWLTKCPSEAYVIPTHFLPLPPEVM